MAANIRVRWRRFKRARGDGRRQRRGCGRGVNSDSPTAHRQARRPIAHNKSVRIASGTIHEILEKLHIEPVNSGACYGDWIPNPSGGELDSMNPATDDLLAKVKTAGMADYECVMSRAAESFLSGAWSRRRGAARSCARSQTNCGCTSAIWARWFRSRWARSCPRAWAKCRR